MRFRLLLAAMVSVLGLAPAAHAAPTVLAQGHFAGSTPPAPPFEPESPIKSFKVEVLH